MFARALLGATLVSVALAAAPPAARAEVKNLNGQVPPDLGNFQQVNGQEKITSLAGLKGKVVMLEFFATW